MMGDTKYPDGWYRVTYPAAGEFIFESANGFIRGSPIKMENIEDEASEVERVAVIPFTQIVEGVMVHAVLGQGPYGENAYIAGVYLDREDALQKIGELDRKYGRGYTRVVSERVQGEYVSPDKPKYSTYEVMVLIDSWRNAWTATVVIQDAHITNYNILQPTDRTAYRIFVRATSVDEAIALAKGVFKDHIGG